MMTQTRVELHPLDKHLCRVVSPYNPLPTFHSAQARDLPCILAVDIETKSNYIAQDLVDFIKLKLEVIPKPHYKDWVF